MAQHEAEGWCAQLWRFLFSIFTLSTLSCLTILHPPSHLGISLQVVRDSKTKHSHQHWTVIKQSGRHNCCEADWIKSIPTRSLSGVILRARGFDIRLGGMQWGCGQVISDGGRPWEQITTFLLRHEQLYNKHTVLSVENISNLFPGYEDI